MSVPTTVSAKPEGPRMWEDMTDTERRDAYLEAADDAHKLRCRCAHLTHCVAKMYNLRHTDDKFALILEVRDLAVQYPTTFERRDGRLLPCDPDD